MKCEFDCVMIFYKQTEILLWSRDHSIFIFTYPAMSLWGVSAHCGADALIVEAGPDFWSCLFPDWE